MTFNSGDSFEGSHEIRIQPGDTSIPITFPFNASSSSGLNSGALPYNSTLSSITIDAHRGDDGVMVSTGNLVQAATDFSYSGNDVTIKMTYSSELSTDPSTYHLKINVTASINATTSDLFTKTFTFNRVKVRND